MIDDEFWRMITDEWSLIFLFNDDCWSIIIDDDRWWSMMIDAADQRLNIHDTRILMMIKDQWCRWLMMVHAWWLLIQPGALPSQSHTEKHEFNSDGMGAMGASHSPSCFVNLPHRDRKEGTASEQEKSTPPATCIVLIVKEKKVLPVHGKDQHHQRHALYTNLFAFSLRA